MAIRAIFFDLSPGPVDSDGIVYWGLKMEAINNCRNGFLIVTGMREWALSVELCGARKESRWTFPFRFRS